MRHKLPDPNSPEQILIRKLIEKKLGTVSPVVVNDDPEAHIPTGVSIDPSITLEDFKGQERAKELVLLNINAWEKDNSSVPGHMLFTGPGGTGKSTIAHAIANRMGTRFITTAPHLLKRPDQIFEFFFTKDYRCKISQGDVIFIDEVHGFDMRMAGFMYNVLQDFCLDYSVREPVTYNGRACARGDVIRLKIPRFLCIGATTDSGLMHPPLRSRFPNRIEFEPYTEEDIKEIVQSYKPVDYDASVEIAKRSAGNPRMSKSLTMHCSLVSLRNGRDVITADDVLEACKIIGVDEKGLDRNARRVVQYFIRTGNKPTGTAPISASTQIYKTTLDGEVFPAMAYAGVLLMTTRGKCLTDEYYTSVKGNEVMI